MIAQRPKDHAQMGGITGGGMDGLDFLTLPPTRLRIQRTPVETPGFFPFNVVGE
jgi:hypothetical protein